MVIRYPVLLNKTIKLLTRKIIIKNCYIYKICFAHLFSSYAIHSRNGVPMSLSLNDQYDKIYKYCYFKVKNKEIAEDLTQETFLKYFNQTSYINRGKPLAYLYTIAKNLCIDFYRKCNKVEGFNDEMIGNDDVSAFETNFAIKQAVSTLPVELQEILLLRFANELSVNEIANIMKISRFTVYRKLNKAFDLLKTILREEDF